MERHRNQNGRVGERGLSNGAGQTETEWMTEVRPVAIFQRSHGSGEWPSVETRRDHGKSALQMIYPRLVRAARLAAGAEQRVVRNGRIACGAARRRH